MESTAAGVGSITFTGALGGAGGLIAGAASHDAHVGQLILDTATNNYSGGTTVNAGTLIAGATSTNAFGSGAVTVVSANSVFAGAAASMRLTAGETNAIADNATLSLAGGNAAGVADDGYITLDSGVNETVGGLILGGVTESTPGTYGATGSGAAHVFDEFFSGGGVVTLAQSAGVPGDYNGNGVVDAADYVLWRSGGPLQNEIDNPGTVDAGDYTAWRARFGNTSGSGSGLGARAVPEPTALALLSVLFLLGLATRRH
jgi:autotransporter-associated beta strand protein